MLYDQEIINKIKEKLTADNNTLAVAESATAGHLQAAFSSSIEASKFFQGGITAYNAGQKCRHLNIEPIHALDNDCVTGKVANEMAINVCRLFLSDYGISITGYASKMPEKNINDLFAFFAIAKDQKIILSGKITTEKERVDAQIDYTSQVIKEFASVLKV